MRGLTEVVLSHLPAHASLAQEQVHLSVGHLQILRAQFDETPAFEREELGDAIVLAGALTDAIEGGQATRAAIAALAAVVATADGSDVRAQFRAINSTIEHLVRAVSADGAAGAKARLSSIILEHERAPALGRASCRGRGDRYGEKLGV